MFTSLSIKNFRGFSDLTVTPLDRINLITGANDVGKTALLEALYLLLGETNPALVVKINAFRGLGKLEGDTEAIREWLWAPLFHKFATGGRIEIEGHSGDAECRRVTLSLVPRTSAHLPLGEEIAREMGRTTNGFATRALQIEYQDEHQEKRTSTMLIDEQGPRVEPPSPNPTYPGYFLAARGQITLEEDAKNLGELLVAKEPFEVLDVLRIVEPRLTRISTILGAGGTIIYGDVGLGKMMPLALLGDGLGRLASLALKIATARHGVVLVDEIENGLHHGVIEQVWIAIGEAARRFDVQVFATTHSWECIQAAHRAFEANGVYDFHLHRLERVRDTIRSVTYDQEALGAALKSELEVR